MLYNGQPDIYALKLQEKYGDGIIRELNVQGRKIKQWQPQELIDLKVKYQNLLKELGDN